MESTGSGSESMSEEETGDEYEQFLAQFLGPDNPSPRKRSKF